jgi:hypothetical protein
MQIRFILGKIFEWLVIDFLDLEQIISSIYRVFDMKGFHM